MIVGSCINLCTGSRLSVGLKDKVERLTEDAATLTRLKVDFSEYLRVPVDTCLKVIKYYLSLGVTTPSGSLSGAILQVPTGW